MNIKTTLSDISKFGTMFNNASALVGSDAANFTDYTGLYNTVRGSSAKDMGKVVNSLGLSDAQKEEFVNANNLIEVYGATTLAQEGLTASTKTLSLAKSESIILDKVDEANKTKAQAILENYKKTNTQVTQSLIDEMVETGALTEKNGALLTSSLGLQAGFTAESVSLKSLWTQYGSMITMVAGLAAAYGLLKLAMWANDKITENTNPYVKRQNKMKELEEEASNLDSKLSKANSELSENQSRIEELQSKGSLTFVEDQELSKLEAANKSLQTTVDLLNEAKSKNINEQLETIYEEATEGWGDTGSSKYDKATSTFLGQLLAPYYSALYGGTITDIPIIGKVFQSAAQGYYTMSTGDSSDQTKSDKDKAQEIIDELQKVDAMTEDEAKTYNNDEYTRLIYEGIMEADRQGKTFDIDKFTEDYVKQAGLTTKSDLEDDLKNQLKTYRDEAFNYYNSALELDPDMEQSETQDLFRNYLNMEKYYDPDTFIKYAYSEFKTGLGGRSTGLTDDEFDEFVTEFENKSYQQLEDEMLSDKDGNLYTHVKEFAKALNDYGTIDEADLKEALSYLYNMDDFATEVTQSNFVHMRDQLDAEIEKAEGMGISGDNLEKLKNGELPSTYGNIDMDYRNMVTYDEEFLEKNAEALKSIKSQSNDADNTITSYYDELVNAIENGETRVDSVLAGLDTYTLSDGKEYDVSYSYLLNTKDYYNSANSSHNTSIDKGFTEGLKKNTVEKTDIDFSKDYKVTNIPYSKDIVEQGIADSINNTFANMPTIVSDTVTKSNNITKVLSEDQISEYVALIQQEAENALSGTTFSSQNEKDNAILSKMLEIDGEEEGRLVGGDYIHGILATLSDSSGEFTTDVNGLLATDTSKLMEFSGRDSTFGKLNSQLQVFYDSFSLSEDDQDAISDYQTKVTALGEALEKVSNGTLSSSDLASLIGDYPTLANETDNLAEAITELADDAYTELYKQMRDEGASQDVLDMLTKIRDTAMDTTAALKELAASENIANLNVMQNSESGWDQLDSIYADVKDGEYFDWSSILNNEDFQNTFQGLGEDYTNFVDTVTKNSSDIEACQSAFNDLATAYIYSDDQLLQVTEDTKDATIAYYEQMGVSNAQEVVEQELAIKEKYLAMAKENGIDVTHDMSDATIEEIASVFAEEEQLDATEQALLDYNLEKYNANNIKLSTTDDINNLIKFIGYLGGATTALQKYAQIKAKYDWQQAQYEQAIADGNTTLATSIASSMSGTTEKLLNGETIVDDSTGGTFSTADIIAEAQAEIDKYYKNTESTLYSPISYTGGQSSNSDSDSDSDSSDSDEETPETFDWVERKITALENVISKLDEEISDTYSSWSSRNKAISNEIGELQKKAIAEGQAYQTYMAKANSLGLSQDYINLIQNGMMRIDEISDETLKTKIQDYETWYDKAQDALKEQLSLEKQINDKVKERLENIKSIYEYSISLTEHAQTMIENSISLSEEKSLFADSDDYYAKLDQLYEKRQKYINERSALMQQLAGTGWDEDSEEYQNIQSEINKLTESISETDTEIVKTNNDLRNSGWDAFDYLEESLNNITTEADYLIKLLEKEDLFDKTNGNFTKYADATAALHAVNYDIYKQQEQDYAEQADELYEQIKKGAGQDVVDKYYEIVQAEQDAAESALDEKDAILQLIEDGYNAQLDAIQEIIDKKKEQLDAEKDLYDYEKNISDKAETVSTIEKQITSLSSDDSEETMAKIQELRVNLKDAQEELQDAEYDQFVQDTETMLDELTDDYKEWMDERLDNEDELIAEVMDKIDTNGIAQRTTLVEVAEKNGSELSSTMGSIFSTTSPFSNMLTSQLQSITDASKSYTGSLNNINSYLAKIADAVNARSLAGNAGTGNGISKTSTSNVTTELNNIASDLAKAKASSTTSTSTSSTKSTSTTSSWGSWFKKGSQYYSAGGNTSSSLVDRLKSLSIDSSFASRATYYSAMGGSGTYTGSASQNTWMLNLMKKNGYKSGTKSVGTSGKYWTQEDGQEIIIRKSDGAIMTPLASRDMVLNSEQTQKLYDFVNGNSDMLVGKYGITLGSQPVTNNMSSSTNVDSINVSLSLPGVTNYEEFRNQLINDNTMEKAIVTTVNNAMMGKSTISKRNYSR